MTSAVLLRGGIYAESRSAAGVTRTAYAFLGIMCENSDPGNPGPFKDFKSLFLLPQAGILQKSNGRK